jgi:hypothetical protein
MNGTTQTTNLDGSTEQARRYPSTSASQQFKVVARTNATQSWMVRHTLARARMKHDCYSLSTLGLICGFTVHRFLVMRFGIRKVHFRCVVHMHIATKASGLQEGMEEREREAGCHTVQ